VLGVTRQRSKRADAAGPRLLPYTVFNPQIPRKSLLALVFALLPTAARSQEPLRHLESDRLSLEAGYNDLRPGSDHPGDFRVRFGVGYVVYRFDSSDHGPCPRRRRRHRRRLVLV
jgi:hypothetical protein